MILKKINNKEKLLIIVPLIIFLFLAVLVKTGITTNFEIAIYNNVSKLICDNLTKLIICITNISGKEFVTILCFLLLVFSKTRLKVGIPISITVFFSGFLNIVLKHIFVRPRPSVLHLVVENGYSFPSGHSMISSAICTMFCILILKYIKKENIKKILLTICIVFPILIGFTRIYLGVHYLTDIIGGYLFGFIVAICVGHMIRIDENIKNNSN